MHARQGRYRARRSDHLHLSGGNARQEPFVPFEAGSMAYDEVRGVLEAAGSVGGACQSIIEEQR